MKRKPLITGPRGLALLVLPALVLLAAAAAGCSRATEPMRDFSRVFLNNTDQSYEIMLEFQQQIKDKKGLTQSSPAFKMVKESRDAIALYGSLEKSYKKNIKKKKQKKGDAKAIKELENARDTFRDCAFVMFVEVKNILPDYQLNELFKNDTPPDAELIIAGLRKEFDIAAQITPPENSCERYQRRAAKIRAELKLKP